MRKIIILLALMVMPILVFGQESEAERALQVRKMNATMDEMKADSNRLIQQLKADLKHQQFLMEQELQFQATIAQIQIQMKIDEINDRIFIERLFPDIYHPTYFWEPGEHPYLSLPTFPLAGGFPLPYNFLDPE